MRPGDTVRFLHYGSEVYGVIRFINEHPGRRNRPTTVTVYCSELKNKLEIPIDAGFEVFEHSDHFRTGAVVVVDKLWRKVQDSAERGNRIAIGE
jgi:hypothetical protein